MLILLKEGNLITLQEWQKLYNKKGNQIGQYFSIGEPHITDDMIVAAPLIVLLDRYRQLKGEPVILNSLYRTLEKQKELIAEGFRAASISPHCVAMAADIDTKSKDDTIKSVAIMQKAAKDVGYPIRIGYKTYMADGNTFFHVDVTPLFYAKGKVFYSKKHPTAWENEIIW